MASKLRLSSLIPAGLVVEGVAESDEKITVMVRSAVQEKACPLCGRYSRRVHSRYVRTITDLPCAGKTVELHLDPAGLKPRASPQRLRARPDYLCAVGQNRGASSSRLWSMIILVSPNYSRRTENRTMGGDEAVSLA